MTDREDLPLFGLRPLASGPQREATDARAGDLLATKRSAGGPDFDGWLADTQGARDYGGEIVHVERLSPRAARHAAPTAPLPPVLARALAGLGIAQLYTHQAQAVDHARAGRPFVLVTGTASGKTLAYNLPVVARRLTDPDA